AGPGIGTGEELVNIYGIAVEADGQILVQSSSRILRIDPATGNRTVVASSTVGTGETLSQLFGFILDTNGDIIIPSSSSLLRIDPDTGNRTVISSSLYTPVGSGPALSSAVGVVKLPDGDFAVLNNYSTDYL